MNTQDGGAFARVGLADEQAPPARPSIDALAGEIFALLKDDSRNEAVEMDLQRRLLQAARSLVRPTGAAEAVVHATLQDLPSSQRDALLMHLGGLTCVQIAQRQSKTHQALMKDLVSAYVRLRLSLNPQDPDETQTITDG